MVSDYAEGMAEEGGGGLNPCCNGIRSQTSEVHRQEDGAGLNPCCNGIWSQTGTLVICCAVVL